MIPKKTQKMTNEGYKEESAIRWNPLFRFDNHYTTEISLKILFRNLVCAGKQHFVWYDWIVQFIEIDTWKQKIEKIRTHIFFAFS